MLTIKVSLTTTVILTNLVWRLLLPVMENTTDVSTESDTVLTCRLRYRCFYSSF